MPADLSVTLGGIDLKNPVIAGSGEATIDEAGLRTAVEAGAAAVVAKSVNESEAARRQLDAAEYVLLDALWRPLPWGPASREASLFCRSGLSPVPFDQWVQILVDADRLARRSDSYVVPSLIVSDIEQAIRMAVELAGAGLRWLELNVGPPHGEEAAPGSIQSTGRPNGVAELVRPIREAVRIPLTVKVGAQGDPLGAAIAAREAGADAVCLTGRHLAFLPDPWTRRAVLGTFGAIGGPWALPLTLRWVAKARRRLGPGYPLIGTNGARDGLDVARFLLAGASAVQMTTSVITDGPAALARTIGEFQRYLSEQGIDARSIIGEAADHAMSYQEAESARER
jgi:dihydroorotate dehydrogenase